jgi:transposase
MTDDEWQALAPLLIGDPSRGGRPADRRRLWDAIFWVACSREPWRALPAALGNPNTARRALARAAHSGVLERLLLAVSPHPLAGREALDSVAYRLLRAFRRIARAMDLRLLLMAKTLGVWTALPCLPSDLPRPGLSEIIARHAPRVLNPETRTPGLLRMLATLHRLLAGAPRLWRTR